MECDASRGRGWCGSEQIVDECAFLILVEASPMPRLMLPYAKLQGRPPIHNRQVTQQITNRTPSPTDNRQPTSTADRQPTDNRQQPTHLGAVGRQGQLVCTGLVLVQPLA